MFYIILFFEKKFIVQHSVRILTSIETETVSNNRREDYFFLVENIFVLFFIISNINSLHQEDILCV
jgi:hypothetical protein